MTAAALLLLLLTSSLLHSGQCTSEPKRIYNGAQYSRPWVNHGGGDGLTNQRVALHEKKISPKSVSSLRLKWSFETAGDVTATPAISDGAIYFPDWAGNMYAVEQATGHLIWMKNLTVLTAGILNYQQTNISKFLPKTIVSRSTPAVFGKILVFGVYGPCAVIAVTRSTGKLLWTKVLDTHPYSLITMSGTAYEGGYYIGTSSLEEGLLNVECCSFQGAFFKLDVYSGRVLWRVLMLPYNNGKLGFYSGVAIWGSSPSIDVSRKLVFIGTGNAYTTPPDVDACLAKERNTTNPPFTSACLPDNAFQESILAISLHDGTVRWSKHLGGYDVFNLLCQLTIPTPPNCPAVLGPDYDFGMAPMTLKIKVNSVYGGSKWQEVVVAAQKSGNVWALDRKTGNITWVTAAGPGGTLGGSSWGSSTDGKRVFVNIINNGNKNFTLVPSHKVTTGSGWVALNASNGQQVWSTADPFAGRTNAPLTYANGVVFGGSTQPGKVVALDAETGKILWSYSTPGPIYGGVSITDGCMFIPVGESLIGISQEANGTSLGNSVQCLCVFR